MLGPAHDGTSDAETSRRTRVDADSKAAMGVDTNGGRLPKTDFRIDLETPSAQCPAGQDHHRRSRERTQGPASPTPGVLRRDLCGLSPAGVLCGGQGRPQRHRELPREAYRRCRAAQAEPAIKALLRRRSKVKRKIDHLRNLGMRQARYRGRRKIRLQAQLAATVAR